METNFFQQIAGLGLTGNIRLNIQSQEDGHMAVSILLVNEETKDRSTRQIPPLVLNGSIQEMDQKFFETVSTPLQKTNSFFCNLKEHESAMKTAQDNRTQKSVSSSTGNNNKRKFDDQMKKVTDLEKLGKIGEAIGQMPDEKSFPEYKKEIDAKMQQLRSKHGTLSLFGEEIETSGQASDTSDNSNELEEENDEAANDNEEEDFPNDNDEEDAEEDDLDPNR
jgi:PRTRC genetic system protein E